MIKHQVSRAMLGAGLSLAVAGIALAQPPVDQAGGRNASAMKFAPVPGVPTCAMAAVQKGDPATTPFILLAKVNTGCVIPWHWHTANEHLMIVSGAARIALRDEGKPITLRAGGFALLPSARVHEFRCKEACTFYLYSDAKFDIHYVDAKGKEIPPKQALEPLNETPATAATAMK